ncbi:MAG: cobalamin-dependent protein [Bacteroidota bacterium]
MAQNLLSTQEVAVMLNVAETTIKRWADENVIACVKTPGGHRKFLLKEVVRFAEAKGYTTRGSQPPPMTPMQLEQLEVGVHTRNYARIADVFKEEAFQADREGILTLFLYLYKHHIPLALIVDEVVRPAFEDVGTKWEKGEIEITQEHAASQATTESLIRMASELHRKGSNGLSVLCACPEDEFHELGLRGLAYSLECEGWKVHYMGPNTPTETLASFIHAVQPELVCLSVAIGRHHRELRVKLKRLSSQVHSYQGKIIIGGHYADRLHEHDITCDHIARSIQDAVAYSRDAFSLKPGPKTKSETKNKLNR